MKDIIEYFELPNGYEGYVLKELIKRDRRLPQLVLAMLGGVELTLKSTNYEEGAYLNKWVRGRYEVIEKNQGTILLHMKHVDIHSGNFETGEQHACYFDESRKSVGRLLLIETMTL